MIFTGASKAYETDAYIIHDGNKDAKGISESVDVREERWCETVEEA